MRKLLFYIGSFGLARGALFVAPIILANLLTASDYGTLEFAYAIASLGAIMISLGTSSVIPLVLISRNSAASWSGVLFHQVVCVTCICLVAVVSWLIDFPDLVWIAAICIAILMLQGLWSVTLKSLGKADASLILDSGFWGVLVVSALTVYAIGARDSLLNASVVGAGIVYLAALFFYTAWRFRESYRQDILKAHVDTLSASMPLLITALLATLATTSGRLGMGFLATPELTGSYAVLFRASVIPIIAHQIILVASFRNLFQLPEQEMKPRLLAVVVSVVLGVIAFWILSGYFGVLLGPAFMAAFNAYRSEGLLILTQCILWSAISLNDLVSSKRLTSGRVAGWGIRYFLIVLPLAWVYLSGKTVTLSLFVPIHSAIMAGYFLLQVVVMRYCGIRLWAFWVFVVSTFTILSILAI